MKQIERMMIAALYDNIQRLRNRQQINGNMECAFGEKWLEFRDKILQWKDTYEYESYSNEFSF
jgi:hypothetical protein